MIKVVIKILQCSVVTRTVL